MQVHVGWVIDEASKNVSQKFERRRYSCESNEVCVHTSPHANWLCMQCTAHALVVYWQLENGKQLSMCIYICTDTCTSRVNVLAANLHVLHEVCLKRVVCWEAAIHSMCTCIYSQRQKVLAHVYTYMQVWYRIICTCNRLAQSVLNCI